MHIGQKNYYFPDDFLPGTYLQLIIHRTPIHPYALALDHYQVYR